MSPAYNISCLQLYDCEQGYAAVESFLNSWIDTYLQKRKHAKLLDSMAKPRVQIDSGQLYGFLVLMVRVLPKGRFAALLEKYRHERPALFSELDQIRKDVEKNAAYIV